MNKDWALAKATAFCQGFQQQFGAWPSLRGTVMALSQTDAETGCGSAWPDSHNMGATTLRPLNADERAVLAAARLVPTVDPEHEARAAAAEAAIVAAGLPLPKGIIKCDSAPGVGPYFVWMAKFDDDVAGFRYYCRLAFGSPGKLKGLYAFARDASTTVEQWATTCYHAGYFTGTHDPRTPDGKAKNIAAYVSFMGRFVPTFTSLLTGFSPDQCEVVPAPYRVILSHGDFGEDVRDAQEHFAAELARIGASPDGVWGNKTDAACVTWRLEHGLLPRAQWDDDCRAKLNGALPDATMSRLGSVQFGDWKADVLDDVQAAETDADLHDAATDAAVASGPVDKG